MQYRTDALGTGFRAALPAGALLPAPLMLEAVEGRVLARVEGSDKNLEAGFLPDGRVYVNADPANASAPLVLFNPDNLDYGMISKEQQGPQGTTRSLQEYIHADGGRTMVQKDEVRADGTRSFNQVHQDAQGNLRAGHVDVDATGKANWTELKSSLNDQGGVTLEGPPAPPPRSLWSHLAEAYKQPFNTKTPLWDWQKEKKLAGKSSVVASFGTFSSALANAAGGMAPAFLAALMPAPVAAPTPQAAPTPSPTPAQGVNVVDGDITRTPAEGILTAVNSFGQWGGGVDRAIARAAGGQYHQQLANLGELKEGQTFVAGKTADHPGSFEKVVFAVDDLKQPLGEVIYNGLKAANDAGLRSINLPAMRTGAMAGVRESEDEAVQATAAAIQKFRSESPENLQAINLVVYNNPQLAAKFNQALAQAQSAPAPEPSVGAAALEKLQTLEGGYTKAHSERAIDLYAMPLARALGVSDTGLATLQASRGVYDIGKTVLPDNLFENRRLEKDEFEQMKDHVREDKIGAILDDLQVSPGVREIALNHHERPDGKGYPNGLSGENIPPLARVVAVADAFDAMTSPRFNREGDREVEGQAMKLDKAVTILRENAGTQFDATVVNTFLDQVLPAALEARVQSGDLSPEALAAFQAKSQAAPQS